MQPPVINRVSGRNLTRGDQECTDLYKDVRMTFDGARVALLERQKPHG